MAGDVAKRGGSGSGAGSWGGGCGSWVEEKRDDLGRRERSGGEDGKEWEVTL